LNDESLDHTPMMAQYLYEAAVNACNCGGIRYYLSKTKAEIAAVFLE